MDGLGLNSFLIARNNGVTCLRQVTRKFGTPDVPFGPCFVFSSTQNSNLSLMTGDNELLDRLLGLGGHRFIEVGMGHVVPLSSWDNYTLDDVKELSREGYVIGQAAEVIQAFGLWPDSPRYTGLYWPESTESNSKPLAS